MSSFISAGRLLAFPGTSLLRRPGGGIRAGHGQRARPAVAAAWRIAARPVTAERIPAGPATAALAAAGLAVLLTGCAGTGQASVALPPKAAAQSPARLADQQGVRQQVVAAYYGYWQATDQALNAGNPARARRILASHAPPSALPGLIAAFRQDWARHAITDGSPVLHIVSVQIRNGRATVHDCADLSHAGLQRARTGRVFPRSFGSPRANYYARLVRQGGRWLVSNIVPVVAQCEP